MRLSHVLADERNVTIEIDGEKLAVTYRPSSFTPEVEDAFLSTMDNRRSGNAMAQVLAGMLVGWDLQDEQGSVYPTTEAELRKLPMLFLGQVVEAIMEDIRPNARKRSSSNGGSLVKG